VSYVIHRCPFRTSFFYLQKYQYANLERLSEQEISRLREEAEQVRITARDLRIKSVGN
jgi:hypothetical protein